MHDNTGVLMDAISKEALLREMIKLCVWPFTVKAALLREMNKLCVCNV